MDMILLLLLCSSLLTGATGSPDSVKFTSIGCFVDYSCTYTQSLEGQHSLLDGSNYKARKNAIQKCASVAKEFGYNVFALQDAGKCLRSSLSFHQIFDHFGPLTQCKRHGKGGYRRNHFYVIGEMKDLHAMIDYKSLGCYVHDRGNKMAFLEEEDPSVLDGNYKLRTDAIEKCALAAMKRSKRVFAIQDGGLCLANRDSNHPTDLAFNKHGISQDCKGDGKGGPGANHVYIIGGIKALALHVEPNRMGCYKELPVRSMQILEGKDHLLDGNYTSRKYTIDKCLLVGSGRGYDVVGIQDGGMCVGSAKLRGFNKYGISRDCKSDGKGGPWANEVYDLSRIKDFLSYVKHESLGCYRDKHARSILSLEGKDSLLRDSYSLRKDAIQKCAVAAKVRGFKTFAIQDGGMCVTDPTAHQNFDKYGKSKDCKNDGKGGPWANQVYNLTGTLEDILSSVYYSNIGCFVDTRARTIPNLERQDPVLHSNYKTRQDPVRKCALAAKKRGHNVFAVMADGQCASGPNTDRNFVKSGYSKSECSIMAVNNSVYIVGYERAEELLPFVEYDSVGCFKDSKERAIMSVGRESVGDFPSPDMFRENYKTREKAVQKCGLFARLQGYKMFAVQDGGLCLTSPTAHKTFDKYGKSQDCKSDGKGGPWANQVYRLPERKAPVKLVKYTSVGCVKDHWNPEIPSLEGQDPRLDGYYYKLRVDAILKCALVAKARGYKVFALQDGGKCLSSSTAHWTIFTRSAGIRRCKSHGRGEYGVNHVYVLGKLETLYSTIKYKSIGCYKRNPSMTVLEGKDPEVLDGYYKFRTDAVDKCALAAKKRRSEMFAVQDGGLCLMNFYTYPIFNKYGISRDCKSDGKGGPGANEVYISGGGIEALISITEGGITVGCFKDLPVRAMEILEGQDHLLDGNYKSRKNAMEKCVLVGRGREYDVVGIQDGGMCVGSAKVRDFNKYGISRDCRSDGKGGPWASEVHVLSTKNADFLATVKYESVGCYRDEAERAIPSMEGMDSLLEDRQYSQRIDANQKCAVAAMYRGYKAFAIQDGGECVSGPNAHQTFDKYGKSKGCKNDGKGGYRANQVYSITRALDVDSISIFYSNIGCFNDTQTFAIPSLEEQDAVLDGEYTTRQDGVRKCALAAKKRLHKTFVVMADGQCRSGPNTLRNFVKFGYNRTKCLGTAMKNSVYLVGYGVDVEHLLPFVEYEPVGCYKDSHKRAIESVEMGYHEDFVDPYMFERNHKERKHSIQKCALFARMHGYKMFAVQDGGMCFTSSTAHKTYNKYGTSQDCKRDGKGGPWANQVYLLPESEVAVDPVKITSVGCFRDYLSIIPSLEGQDQRLDGSSYKERKHAIEKCAVVAKERGYKVFSLLDGGMCRSGPNAHIDFNILGRSNFCKSHGKGGVEEGQVYVIGGIKALYSVIEYESIGCYKHKPGSKMIVLEGTDPQVLDGNYKHRADAIEKCALAAMKKDYLAFAVQDGGLCLGTCHVWGIQCIISQGGISHECKSDGKGGSRAINVYAVGSIEALAARVEDSWSPGCYKDLPVRAMEILEGQDHLLDGNYTSRKYAMDKCLLVGRGRGYEVVGIQDGGMCVGSAKLRDFNKYGISNDCSRDGKGGPWATQVYDLSGQTRNDYLSYVKYKSVGCYRDKSVRAIPSLEGNDTLLNGSYSLRNDAIRKCALAAMVLGYQTFAIQDGGMCVGGPNAHNTYDKYGRSQGCKNNGKGGPWANQVYNLTETVEDFFQNLNYIKVGCLEDAQAVVIPSLEGQDPVLDGNYFPRENHIAKCALAANKRGHKVFVVMADGQCASDGLFRNFVQCGHSALVARNRVYVLGNPFYVEKFRELFAAIKFESVGCYKDSYERAIKNVDGYYSIYFPIPRLLIDNYKTREQAIQKCALFAKLQGYQMFAVQDGGLCLTSPTAHKTYNKYGKSQDCKSDGKGGPRDNQVYRLQKKKND